MADAEPTPPSTPGSDADLGARGPWSEPVRGGHPDLGLMALTGLEQLRQILSGAAPEPPLSRLTGLKLESVEPGAATFTMPLSGWLPSSDGLITLGPLAIPADAAMACAVMSELPPWTPFTTSEMAVRVLRPIQPGGRVRAEGRVIAPGPGAALADVRLHDDAGRLIAHGSSLCVTLPSTAPAPQAAAEHVPDAPAPGPDPWQRPVASSSVAPLERLTGLTQTHARDGQAEFTLPASRWFCAPPPGRLQGGVVVLLAEAALFRAVRSAVPATASVTPVEVKINFLRPLGSDGRLAKARGRLVHAGRRIAVGTAEVTDADGRTVAILSGSALLNSASEKAG